MANEYYISAGIPPNDDGKAGTVANTFYISAGLVPDDEAVAGGIDSRIVLLTMYQYRNRKS